MRGLTILWLCLLFVAPAAAQSSFVDSERVRLRAHFDEVLAELEAADTSALSEDQRARRAVHVERLAQYRDRGVFPLRYGGPSHRVPEFRDVHGTRCAMGELIYLSGETQLVDDVASTANSATIAELSADPRLARWLSDNGLTVEEAGRVQPSYAPWRAQDCLCVDSTSQWRGVVTTHTIFEEGWSESDSGYNEYAVQVELVEPLRGVDGHTAGETMWVDVWYSARVGEPVLVAFEDDRGWAFPVDDDFSMVGCAIERSAYHADVPITCENPVAVSLDVALDAMSLVGAECRAALDTQADLAPCPKDDGCSVGAPAGSPAAHVALFGVLAVALVRRRRRR